MNRGAAIFATTTAIFAACTLYLYRKVETLEAATGAAPATAVDAVQPGAGRLTSTPHVVSTSDVPVEVAAQADNAAAAASRPAAVAAAPVGKPDASREVMTPFARDFLRQYDDPAQRSLLARAARAGVVSQYSRLRDQLKLDAARFDQLVDLLVEEQLEAQAGFSRCMLDPRCDPSRGSTPRDRSDEYLALLGGDDLARFNAYRGSLPDWQSVVQLRGRLPESMPLSDANADRLLTALSAERTRYAMETNQAGAKLQGWGNGTGMIWYSGDGGAAEQLASATQYSERLRQAAGTVLTPDQLRTFTQLQEEMLAGLAAYLQSRNRG